MEGPQRLAALIGLLVLGGCTLAGSPERPAPPPSGAVAPASAGSGTSDRGAVPRAEPPSRGGNMAQYRQFGETYRVLDSSYGYDRRGIASWYGEAFDGRPTSSGEPFDMHALTAAHRTLPLPAYVEVTNLANGRTLVVRVNDRGPFHDTDRRIIDVSYAAAVRLGMDKTGTASVRVRAVEPWQSRTASRIPDVY